MQTGRLSVPYLVLCLQMPVQDNLTEDVPTGTATWSRVPAVHVDFRLTLKSRALWLQKAYCTETNSATVPADELQQAQQLQGNDSIPSQPQQQHEPPRDVQDDEHVRGTEQEAPAAGPTFSQV